jgi:hypothetical protein
MVVVVVVLISEDPFFVACWAFLSWLGTSCVKTGSAIVAKIKEKIIEEKINDFLK